MVLLRTGLGALAGAAALLGRCGRCSGSALGGRLGSGRQYMPWISLDDEVGAIRFLLEHDEIAGPVNLAGPDPVTNAEFTARWPRRCTGRRRGSCRGSRCGVAVGDGAEEILLRPAAGARGAHGRGFTFRYPVAGRRARGRHRQLTA